GLDNGAPTCWREGERCGTPSKEWEGKLLSPETVYQELDDDAQFSRNVVPVD
ncbi:hypothetical protein AVEN_183806-1, partial [Araneus ventricosus]